MKLYMSVMLSQQHGGGFDLRLLGRHIVALGVTSDEKVLEIRRIVQSCGEAKFEHMEIFLDLNGGVISLVGHLELREEGAPGRDMQGRLD